MRALIVFDSMFGNTGQIARAVADGLAEHARVDVVRVDDVRGDVDDDVDLLVVGGPTHAHGMSNRTTRRASPQQVADGATPGAIGLREWLDALAPPPRAVAAAAAAFDTRFDKPAWLTGSAARGAAKRLRERGFTLAAPPESFFVAAGNGPLAEGELDRARRWGRTLGASLAAAGGDRVG